MDIQEATNRVLANLQRLDHENATKIMGHILIQDQGDKEIIRLAFFSDTALRAYINQAKSWLGLQNSNNNHHASSPTTPHSNSNPFPQTTTTSPRIMVPNNGFHLTPNPSSPLSRTTSPISSSYAAVLNGSSSSGGGQVSNFSGPGSPGLGFYGGGNEFALGGENGGHVSFLDDTFVDHQIAMSPSGRSDSVIFPYNNNNAGGDESIVVTQDLPHSFHRRTCSANAFLTGGFEEEKFNNVVGGDYYKPCMYFARGHCRNGSDCKFSHGDFGGDGFEVVVSSPGRDGLGFDDYLRAKAFQQKLALMGSGGRSTFSSSYNKCMSFLEGNHRNEFSHMDFGGASSSSANQIYLTFPADSTFKEEDVTNYFSMFGPVRDVRIPYQQKRMFGFVTFVYPETVKLILAKGNPHFVCDSRVLVKPYKEKGKILQKKHHHQHLDKCDYLASLSPSEFDTRELYDLPVGPRILNSQEIMRRRFEQAAIEFQTRKMMNLQLADVNNQHTHDFHFPRGVPNCIPVSSPRMMNQNVIASSSDASNQGGLQEFGVGEYASKSMAMQADELKSGSEVTESSNDLVDGGRSSLHESFEHALPDNLFASPTKSTAEWEQAFSYVSSDNNNNDSAANTSSIKNVVISGNSPIDIASHVTIKWQAIADQAGISLAR